MSDRRAAELFDLPALIDGDWNASQILWHDDHVPPNVIDPLTIGDIVGIERWSVIARRDYADTDICGLVWLTGQRYAAVVAWSDSTGWGCQDSVRWTIGTRDNVITYGLGDDERQRLGLAVGEGT